MGKSYSQAQKIAGKVLEECGARDVTPADRVAISTRLHDVLTGCQIESCSWID